MARNADPHPSPDLPDSPGSVPHFPTGTPEPDKGIGLERPGRQSEVPGEDYPPERKPFPDHTPDPGITHE
ncbi:MAG TPA: hypothetical protein VFE52_03245 [Devosia sp.]|jgi:hypothetical protein|nr:hypothetical protein [Devosia sp.]